MGRSTSPSSRIQVTGLLVRISIPLEGASVSTQVLVRKYDWDIEYATRYLANRLFRNPHPEVLSKLIEDSEKSAAAWDILQLTCQKFAYEDERMPPYGLLRWCLSAQNGHPKRPDEEPAPNNRPPRLGYKLRDNEIRHTVDLLVQVGMLKTVGCEAVAEAFHDSKYGLSESRIRQICREPYWTMDDLGTAGMKRLNLSLDSHPYWAWLYFADHPSTPKE